MKAAKIGASIAILGAVVGLIAAQASASLKVNVFAGSILGSTNRFTADNGGAGDSGEAQYAGGTSTIRARLLAGTVGATTSLVNSAGSVVNGCTVTDPPPVNAGSVTFVCPGPFTGVTSIQLTVD